MSYQQVGYDAHGHTTVTVHPGSPVEEWRGKLLIGLIVIGVLFLISVGATFGQGNFIPATNIPSWIIYALMLLFGFLGWHLRQSIYVMGYLTMIGLSLSVGLLFIILFYAGVFNGVFDCNTIAMMSGTTVSTDACDSAMKMAGIVMIIAFVISVLCCVPFFICGAKYWKALKAEGH